MELHNYALKFIFVAFFATFSAAFGWNSEAEAAKPNGLIKMLNDADRALCRSLKTKCRAQGKTSVAKRQKPLDEKPADAPPIPVQKPLVAQDVAAPAPIPREKPESLQKQAALQPDALPGDTPLGKVDKLASSTPLQTQRPVIAPKAISTKSAKIADESSNPFQKPSPAQEAVTPAPIPRTKPQGLQKQAAIIPRVVPKDTPHDDPDNRCLQELRAMGAKFTVPPVNVDSGKCHVQNPVNLRSVKAQGSSIKLSEAPLFNCKFALQFSKWLSEAGAPILAAQLDAPLDTISTGPGFECRGRNGDGSAKISEHGYGNAVDITTLRMRDGKVINVAGSTLFDGFRTSACGYFTTVLGPGSNAAHEKHFHFDLGLHGKSGNYRICE
jgi:hypothetical protein